MLQYWSCLWEPVAATHEGVVVAEVGLSMDVAKFVLESRAGDIFSREVNRHRSVNQVLEEELNHAISDRFDDCHVEQEVQK
jgi:hypothetical protein